MPKTVLDPHITGPRISADKLVMAALLCLIPSLMWFGLGATGIADFNSGDFGTSLSVLAIVEVAYAILAAYVLTVATGAFEVLVRSTRFFIQDFPASLTFGLGMVATRYSQTTSILRAFPPDIMHGATDAAAKLEAFPPDSQDPRPTAGSPAQAPTSSSTSPPHQDAQFRGRLRLNSMARPRSARRHVWHTMSVKGPCTLCKFCKSLPYWKPSITELSNTQWTRPSSTNNWAICSSKRVYRGKLKRRRKYRD